MACDLIDIPRIALQWSAWTHWHDLMTSGAGVPSEAGVYEVRATDSEERLHIGKTGDLNRRIIKGLVKGSLSHSTGQRIRPNEDLGRLVVRWARTDRPAAVEEELHRRHVAQYGRLPKYTLKT